VKLITRLILLLVTFYNPAFAGVFKSDDGTGYITLTNEDAVYAIENGIVLSSEPDASIYNSFNFMLLFNKQVWNCRYFKHTDEEKYGFICTSENKYIISNR